MADNPPKDGAEPGPKAGERKAAARFARRAAALRENLRKRKARNRARAAEAPRAPRVESE